MSKKQKKRMSRAKRLMRSGILLVLLVAIISGVCLFAPFFNITQIKVEGNAQVLTEEILDRAPIVVGTNIFKLNKRTVKKSLASLAYLDKIKVKRRLPSTVRIKVTESYAHLLFPYASGYIVTDEFGKVLEEISDCTGWDLPQVTGVEIEQVKISEKITVQDRVKFDIILDCIEYFNEHGHLENMSVMDFSDITNIWITYKEGFSVNFAKFENMDYKLKMLDAVLPQVDRSEGTYIDLTTPSKVFTGKKEPTPEPTPETIEGEETNQEETGAESETNENKEEGSAEGAEKEEL